MGLTAASCVKRTTTALKTPSERLICEPAGARPSIPPEHQIDWSAVQTVDQAKSEHDRYVRRIRDREGVVVGYLVSLEGKHVVCVVNMEWRRDFEAGLPE